MISVGTILLKTCDFVSCLDSAQIVCLKGQSKTVGREDNDEQRAFAIEIYPSRVLFLVCRRDSCKWRMILCMRSFPPLT